MPCSKKILVTGAAGFIGFHAALALNKRGDFVVGLDNFNDYYSPDLKRRRAARLLESGIHVVEGNLSDKKCLEKLFETHPFTHILNLAAQAGVRYALVNPDAYLESNLVGFVALLETCRHYPNIKIVYASSSSVYGQNEKTPFSITDRTDSPANLYAATKKANELIATSYQHLFGLHLTGLRYFTVYGPWGRPDMAYYSFTEAILSGKPIHLFNEGKMERDFTYIDDAISGTLAALDLEAKHAVFNIGNHQPVSVLEFVSLLEKKLGKKGNIVLEGSSKGEVKTTFADIKESQEQLGFDPKTNLSDGLDHFIRWYQEV